MNLTKNGPSAIPQFPQPGTITDGVFTRLLGRRTSQTFKAAYAWLKHERNGWARLPVSRRLQMWREGFYAESAMLYDLPHNDAREYLSDYTQAKRCANINSYNEYFKHKLVLGSFLRAMGFRQAETVALLYEGRVLHDPFGADGQHIEPEELIRRLSATDRDYIVKPEDGDSGQDLFRLEARAGRLVRRSGRDTTPFDVGSLLRQSARDQPGERATLIEERLEQGSFWRGLFPESANTIRLLTLWIPGEPAPFIARAVQRIGRPETVPSDNWSGGGISVSIDLTSGALGEGRLYATSGKESIDTLVTRHPDTGSEITGTVLPDWERVKDTVLRAAGSLPFNRMAAWDVLVTTDGEPVIIEADGDCDINVFQVHGGLLTDPRIRRFYQEMGVVGPSIA